MNDQYDPDAILREPIPDDTDLDEEDLISVDALREMLDCSD